MKINISRNKSLIFMEGMASNVLTLGVQSFSLTSLALYFNCSPFWLSVMASLPIGAQLLQVFIGKFYKVFNTRKKALVYSAILGRLPFILIPIAILFNISKPWILVGSVLCYSFFNSFNLSVWTATVGDVIPKDDRSNFFAKRYVFLSIVAILFSYIGGKVLNIPEGNIGVFLIALFISVSSIISIICFMFQTVPEGVTQEKKIGFLEPLKNENFKKFLIFSGAWNFSIELTRPYFAYYSKVILGVDYNYLGVMAALTGILSILFYPFVGKLGDKYGCKKIVAKGIIGSTYVIMLYIFMGTSNYRSLLLFDAIGTSIAWAAINLSLFNLLLEVAEDPIDSYVAAYYVAVGSFGLLGGVVGGILGSFLKDMNIHIIGDPYNGLQILIGIGLLLRLYSVLLLTRVESYERPVYYEGLLQLTLNIFGFRK